MNLDRSRMIRIAACALAVMVFALMPNLWASAAEGGEAVKETAAGSSKGLAAIGAALAIGLAALATGIAQAKIGAAGMGAVAENPKRLGMVIMLVAIPETVAILGFVIAYLILKN
jgi:V/A-type H+-transporting ATPase subunit K